MIPLRTLARRSLSSPTHSLSRRNFSIDGQAARTLLTRHLDWPKSSIKDTSSSSSSLSILLHADRRPQTVHSRTHFGPSILACATASLQAVRDAGVRLGRGDLGLLKLQEVDAGKVVQWPIAVEEGLSESAAGKFLKTTSEVTGAQLAEASKLLSGLWRVFDECEGIWFTAGLDLNEGGIALTNPYLSFDPFSLSRVKTKSPTLWDLYTTRQRDSITAKAEDGGLFYIDLQNGGNIGSFGYGAGNAMGTMDGLSNAGGKPANFLDGGGGANRQNAKLAIETLNSNPAIRTIFVNTFGGITQTDVVADGIIDAVREHGMKQTIVVRVKGTGSDEAKRKLTNSGLDNFILIDDFRQAAKEAVRYSQSGAV